MSTASLLLLTSLSACTSPAGDGAWAPRPDQPVELGAVRWRTDHDAAFREAAGSDRPVLLLFQEIPG